MRTAFAAVVFGYVSGPPSDSTMLHRWRIALAPWWMQSVDDDRLVEWRCPPRHTDKSIKAVRYTAKCPCVAARSLRVQEASCLPGTLVGRCEEAPAARLLLRPRAARRASHYVTYDTQKTAAVATAWRVSDPSSAIIKPSFRTHVRDLHSSGGLLICSEFSQFQRARHTEIAQVSICSRPTGA